VIVLILGALAFVATKALSDAALFFYNADEAVAKRDELGDSRFPAQGTVMDGTISGPVTVWTSPSRSTAEVRCTTAVPRPSCSKRASLSCSRVDGIAPSTCSTVTACS
jgi:hypothetical protein